MFYVGMKTFINLKSLFCSFWIIIHLNKSVYILRNSTALSIITACLNERWDISYHLKRSLPCLHTACLTCRVIISALQYWSCAGGEACASIQIWHWSKILDRAWTLFIEITALIYFCSTQKHILYNCTNGLCLNKYVMIDVSDTWR